MTTKQIRVIKDEQNHTYRLASEDIDTVYSDVDGIRRYLNGISPRTMEDNQQAVLRAYLMGLAGIKSHDEYCASNGAYTIIYDMVNESSRSSRRMRERLFRGKCIEGEKKGKWVYGVPFTMPSGDCYIIEDISECFRVLTMWKVDSDTVGQYAEVSDSEYERIFEGDIVRWGDTIHKVVFERRFDSAYFGIVMNELETWPFGHYVNLRDIKVIGNIYDDPEIIE